MKELEIQKSEELGRNLYTTFRNNNRRCSVKKGVLKDFTNLTGKHLCWSLFLIKLQACRTKFLRTPILENICERLIFYFEILEKGWCRSLFQGNYYKPHHSLNGRERVFKDLQSLVYYIRLFLLNLLCDLLWDVSFWEWVWLRHKMFLVRDK